MTFSIDWAFIGRLEGKAITTGYVPQNASTGQALGQSGVTIATGFDIGQHDEAYLARVFGEGTDLYDLLSPHAGLKRSAAIDHLAKNPLTVTDVQAAAIDKAVKTDKATQIARAYDAAVMGTGDRRLKPFRQLPREAQTVIMSVAFQYGNLARATPTFWRHVVAQDWPATYRELSNFGDQYGSRRRQEAQYLRPLTLTKAGVR